MSTPELPRRWGTLTVEYRPAVSERVLQDLLTGLRARAPRQAHAQVERELRKRDLLTEFDAGLGRALSLDRRNLAHATAAYWISMWCIAHTQALPDAPLVEAVVDQIEALLIRQRMGRKAVDRRQALAEAMIYEAVLGYTEYETAWARDDHGTLKAMAINVRRNMRQRGLNLSRMRLTESGFSGIPSRLRVH